MSDTRKDLLSEKDRTWRTKGSYHKIFEFEPEPCPNCGGFGTVDGKPCPVCEGEGIVYE